MAEKRGAIRAVIEAVDRVTAPVRRMGAGVSAIVRSLNLDQARAQIGRVVTGLVETGKAAAQMATRIAVSATAAATALALITRSVAETTQASQTAARAVNVSLQGFQALAHAARLVGSNSDQMAGALGALRDKALEAAQGNWELRRAFRLMGVQLLDSNRQLRPTEDLLNDVADAFARVPDSARRTRAAMELFGEAGAALIPLLEHGRLGLAAMRADARSLGLVLSDAEARSLSRFNASLRRLTSAITGVQNAIAVRLAPILTPLINDFTNWIAANRQLIATRVEEYVRAIPGAVQSVREQVEALWSRLKPFIGILGDWAKAFGVVNTIALLLAVRFATPLIVNVLALASAIVGPGIGALIQFARQLRTGMGVMAAFNAVLLANPIGAIVALVAVLGGAAYLIYRNWGPIADFFGRLWSRVRDTFRPLVGWFSTAFAGEIAAIQRVWNRLPEFGQRLWDDFKTPFVAFGGWVMTWATGPVTEAVDAFKRAWSALPDFFKGLWDGIKESFDAVWGWIRPIIDRIERLMPSLPSAPAMPTPRTQPDGRRPGTVNGARRIEGWDEPDGVAPPVRAVRPGPGQRVDAGGTIELRITDDRVNVTRVEPNDRRIEFRVDTGASLVTP